VKTLLISNELVRDTWQIAAANVAGVVRRYGVPSRLPAWPAEENGIEEYRLRRSELPIAPARLSIALAARPHHPANRRARLCSGRPNQVALESPRKGQ
jgi:hypothetical protein